MLIYIYIYTHIFIYLFIYICIYTYTYTCTYLHLYTHTYSHALTCLHTHKWIDGNHAGPLGNSERIRTTLEIASERIRTTRCRTAGKTARLLMNVASLAALVTLRAEKQDIHDDGARGVGVENGVDRMGAQQKLARWRIDKEAGRSIRSTLNHPATHCNTLQHTATHCNTLQQDIRSTSNKSSEYMYIYIYIYVYIYVFIPHWERRRNVSDFKDCGPNVECRPRMNSSGRGNKGVYWSKEPPPPGGFPNYYVPS